LLESLEVEEEPQFLGLPLQARPAGKFFLSASIPQPALAFSDSGINAYMNEFSAGCPSLYARAACCPARPLVILSSDLIKEARR